MNSTHAAHALLAGALLTLGSFASGCSTDPGVEMQGDAGAAVPGVDASPAGPDPEPVVVPTDAGTRFDAAAPVDAGAPDPGEQRYALECPFAECNLVFSVLPEADGTLNPAGVRADAELRAEGYAGIPAFSGTVSLGLNRAHGLVGVPHGEYVLDVRISPAAAASEHGLELGLRAYAVDAAALSGITLACDRASCAEVDPEASCWSSLLCEFPGAAQRPRDATVEELILRRL